MSKNSKIQTMSDDLNELGSDSQEFSQQAEKEKKKPIAKTVDADSAIKQEKNASMDNIVKEINPEKSMVESVISSMANGGMNKQKKNKLSTEGTEKVGRLGEGDVNELQNLVSRISDTVPERKSSFAITEEEVLDRRRLPKLNSVEPEGKEEKISKEIDAEMEARINKEIGKRAEEDKIIPTVGAKINKETEIIKDSKIDENIKVDKESQKDEDAKKLKDLIGRISKTAGKEAKKENAMEKMEGILEKKETKEVKALNNKEGGTMKMPLTGIIQKKLSSESSDIGTEDVSDQNKIEDKKEKSFWSNISEKLKKGESHEEADKVKNVREKKIKTVQNEKVLENKIEKPNKSGILTRSKRKVKEIKKEKSAYPKAGEYVLPENRLIHEKQRFYSSVSKKIKLRKDKGEIEGLKNASDLKKKQKIISREEEYGKLKKNIISKYHIKLFQLPWKKIIPVSLVVLLVAGASFYYAMSVLVPEPNPQPFSNIVFGEELSEFMNVEKRITISESSLKGLDSLEKNANDIFDENHNLKVIKLVIVNTEDEEGRNNLSLKNSLDALRIIDTENNKNNLPEKFLEMSTNKYNSFIFRTKEYHIRYGIAIGLKDRYLMSEIMREWEKERSINKKMIAVLKPLFAGDRNYEDIYRSFSSENYSGVEIRYVHLMDEDTALNYFIYSNDEDDGNDLLVITTSRDSAHIIADLLVDNQ